MKSRIWIIPLMLILYIALIASCTFVPPTEKPITPQNTDIPSQVPATPDRIATGVAEANAIAATLTANAPQPTETSEPVDLPSEDAKPTDTEQAAQPTQPLSDKVTLIVTSTVEGYIEMDGSILTTTQPGMSKKIKIKPGLHYFNFCNTANACNSDQIDINSDPYKISLGRAAQ